MLDIGSSLSQSSYFGDTRLNTRLGVIIEQLLPNVGKSIPQSCCNVHQSKALYRFMDNKKVNSSRIQDSENERIVKKLCVSPPKILIHVQDTTTINLSDQKSACELPCLNYPDHKGLFVHTSLLLSSKGDIHGVLHQSMYGRSVCELGTKRRGSPQNKSLPIATKESFRWIEHLDIFTLALHHLPNTRGISICDREGDFFELYQHHAIQNHRNIDLIIRSNHDRHVYQHGKSVGKISNVLACVQPIGRCFISTLHNKDTHRTRIAELEIRYTKVALTAPERLKTTKKNTINATKEQHTIYIVEAKERNPPIDTKPIHWILMTTLPVNDLTDALQIISYYGLRWNIEIFHLVLKEGYAIEKLQLLTLHRLKNAIAIYSIVAAQITHFKLILKEQPQASIETLGYKHTHYNLLVKYLNTAHQFKLPILEHPTVKDFLHIVALLGTGKVVKEIGIRALWLGYTKAHIIFKTAFALKFDTNTPFYSD